MYIPVPSVNKDFIIIIIIIIMVLDPTTIILYVTKDSKNNPVQDFSLFHDGNVYCDGSVFFSDDFHSCICFGEHLIYNHHLSLTSDWKCQADSTVRGQGRHWKRKQTSNLSRTVPRDKLLITLCLLVCGDVHPCPGPRPTAVKNVIKHLASLVAHVSIVSEV